MIILWEKERERRQRYPCTADSKSVFSSLLLGVDLKLKPNGSRCAFTTSFISPRCSRHPWYKVEFNVGAVVLAQIKARQESACFAWSSGIAAGWSPTRLIITQVTQPFLSLQHKTDPRSAHSLNRTSLWSFFFSPPRPVQHTSDAEANTERESFYHQTNIITCDWILYYICNNNKSTDSKHTPQPGWTRVTTGSLGYCT